jgi:5-methylcytosine-specific restriction endonuclease McrA
MAKPRDYKREYRLYHGLAKQKANRAARGRARTKMGLKDGDPRVVDHKKPLMQGGSNSKANLRVTTKKKNLARKRK